MNKVIPLITKEQQKFYNSDTWNLSEYPDEKISKYFAKKSIYNVLDFSIINSENKKHEAKLFFQSILSTKYNNQRFRLYFGIPSLANKFTEDSFLNIDKITLEKLYKDVCKELNMDNSAYKIIKLFHKSLFELLDTREGTNRDIWYLDTLSINPERLNKAKSIHTLNFRNIINENNREYMKIWVKYMIGSTEFAISTIMNDLNRITNFLNCFSNIDAFDLTSDNIDLWIETHKKKSSQNHINKVLYALKRFYNYFNSREKGIIKSPILERHFLKEVYIPASNLVSENVILQIFKNLHTLEMNFRLMFLINYCTGMRISDMCQIKSKDCVFEEDNSYYITYFTQKMQKDCINIIPKALYDLIKNYKSDSIYLFPSLKDLTRPMCTFTYSQRMKKWIKQCNILNDDGSPYKYKTHSFRHTLSTDLYQNYDVDIQVIQLGILKHQEIQMTLTYAERGQEFLKKIHDKYISMCGEIKPINVENPTVLQERALDNGFCDMPNKLNICPNSYACLDCEYFRTSKAFLDIHKQHLKNIQSEIKYYTEMNLKPNLKTALDIEKKLIKIIDILEKL